MLPWGFVGCRDCGEMEGLLMEGKLSISWNFS